MSESAHSSLSTHRVIQLSELADTAAANRVRYYCCAINASSIGNRTMAIHFTARAQQCERIRVACYRRLYGGAA